MAASSWLRIAVVQFAPKIGEVHANIAKARDLCRGLTPRSVDLVCFPEMIFTGYVFPDALSIKPYLEHPKTGPTASFCAALARRLECFVVAGYPERLESPSPSPSTLITSVLTSDPDPLIGANAAAVYDATGHLVHTYHKSNLFPTDRTWARPGPGFTALDLPLPFGRTAVAICNDLNVDVRAGGGWESIERGPYELAWWCQREGVRVLVLLNAWLKPEDGGMEGVEGNNRGDRDQVVSAGENGEDALEPNWEVLNYWAMRLRPLWAKPSKGGNEKPEVPRQSETSTDVAAQANDEREVIVAVCNRCGNERGKTFAGSSAMFSMRRGSGKPGLLHVMGEQEQGVCVWTTRIGSQTLSS
ncbi:carbon-nitrogen hydrolase [Boletus coccyginus]|nr:carbon-nitrogen hydrolase [Boletus coccyginus]